MFYSIFLDLHQLIYATIYFIVPTIVYNDWLDFNVPICDFADWHC